MIVISCNIQTLKLCEKQGDFGIHPGSDLGSLAYDLLYSQQRFSLLDVLVEDSAYLDMRFDDVWGVVARAAVCD